MSAEQVLTEVSDRITGVVGYFANRLVLQRIDVHQPCTTFSLYQIDRLSDVLIPVTTNEPNRLSSHVRVLYAKCTYFNRLVHWDIDNENLHGGWFEETTGVHDLLAQMFIDVDGVDPNALLFINEYDVVRDGILTVVSILEITLHI